MLPLLVACGDGASTAADGGRDAGPESDANPDQPEASDGAATDASTGADASSATDASPSADLTSVFDGALPGAGSGALEGNLAFPVGVALMGFVTDQCRNGPPGPGVTPAVDIGLAQAGATSEALCGAATAPDGGVGSIIDIGIATTQWAAYAGVPLTQSLAPGTYIISNEHEDDEDLCMLAPGGSAYLLLAPLHGDSLSIATSGTVTITSIGADSVSGTFDVTMGGAYGQTDGGTSQLSGAFDAVMACP